MFWNRPYLLYARWFTAFQILVQALVHFPHHFGSRIYPTVLFADVMELLCHEQATSSSFLATLGTHRRPRCLYPIAHLARVLLWKLIL